MTTIKRDSLLGLVFFGGLILILYATYKLSSFSWTPRSTRIVFFKHARGLQAGHDVLVLGKKYGNVTKVETNFTNKERPIQVTVELIQPITFHEGYRIQILEASFLGGRMISINPGPSTAVKVKEHESLEGEAPKNAIEAIADFFSGGDNNENFANILSGFRQIVDDVMNQRGTLGKAIMDPKLWNDMTKIFEDIRVDIETQKGALGLVLNDSKFKTDLASAVENLSSISEKFDSGDSTFALFLNDSKFASDLQRAADNIAKITDKVAAGRGTLGKILMDDATERKFDKIMDSVAKATKALNDPEAGMIGALLHDEKVGADFKNIADKFSKVADQLAGSEGLFGRLINDRDLADKVTNLVNSLARAIEDRREAAPVQTLFSVFGGVFQ